MTDTPKPPSNGAENQPDLLALAESAAAAAERAPRDVGRLVHAANMFLRAGDPARAAALARAAAALDPTDFRAIRTLSGILDAIGERNEAIEAAGQAVGLDPTNLEARLHLGGLLAAQRRWREAAEHLSIYVTAPGATPRGWRLLSSVQQQAGYTEIAIDAARRAIMADANNIEYRLNLVSLLSARGLYEQALDELATALTQAPGNALVWRTQSGVHAAAGNLSEALRAAERAVELAGEDVACLAHLEHVTRLCGLVESDTLAANPDAWSIRPRRTVMSRKQHSAASLSEEIAMHWRVIYAIMLRDIRTRYGHSRIGYIWAIIEPISHLCTLGVVFYALNHSPAPVGESLFLFYITGLIPFLMFSHVSHDVMGATDGSADMLQLPTVKRTDVMVAQALRQLATELCTGIIIFSIAGLLGFQAVPTDPLTAMAAIALLWMLAVGIGAFNLVISGMYPSYEVFYNSLVRLLYFTSGIYYTPIKMPDWVRDILIWNPILQGVEFFRSGFFHLYEPHWLDVNYLLTWVVTSLLLGFCLERALRSRMVVHT